MVCQRRVSYGADKPRGYSGRVSPGFLGRARARSSVWSALMITSPCAGRPASVALGPAEFSRCSLVKRRQLGSARAQKLKWKIEAEAGT